MPSVKVRARGKAAAGLSAGVKAGVMGGTLGKSPAHFGRCVFTCALISVGWRTLARFSPEHPALHPSIAVCPKRHQPICKISKAVTDWERTVCITRQALLSSVQIMYAIEHILIGIHICAFDLGLQGSHWGMLKWKTSRPTTLGRGNSVCCASDAEIRSCFGAAMARQWLQHLVRQGPLDLRPGGAALAGAAGRIAA